MGTSFAGHGFHEQRLRVPWAEPEQGAEGPHGGVRAAPAVQGKRQELRQGQRLPRLRRRLRPPAGRRLNPMPPAST